MEKNNMLIGVRNSIFTNPIQKARPAVPNRMDCVLAIRFGKRMFITVKKPNSEGTSRTKMIKMRKS
jgi:hypothetical protein